MSLNLAGNKQEQSSGEEIEIKLQKLWKLLFNALQLKKTHAINTLQIQKRAAKTGNTTEYRIHAAQVTTETVSRGHLNSNEYGLHTLVVAMVCEVIEVG